MKPVAPAARTAEIRYAVRDVTVLADQVARTGKPMLYLNIGDPLKFDFRTPPHLVEAVHKAMRDGRNGYAPSSGTDEAVGAIRREAERKGIREIREIYVTNGASEAIELALTALVNPGENVLLPAPGYPLYNAICGKIGAVEKHYYLDEANGWQPDVDGIAAAIDAKTRVVVLINPNNPTGSICTPEILRRLAGVARERGVVLFADEIYDKLLFDGNRHVSLASLAPDLPIVTFNGLSKSYLACGWRIGWGIVSGPAALVEDYCEAIRKMTRARLCANHPMQAAIRPALEGPQDHIAEMNARLQKRRDLTVEMLNSAKGLSCVKPEAAFYAFPRIDVRASDEEFTKSLIRETGVVLVHGSGFGQKPGTKHCRVVFLPEPETLRKAYGLLAEFVGKSR